jgi:hypothetical protein
MHRLCVLEALTLDSLLYLVVGFEIYKENLFLIELVPQCIDSVCIDSVWKYLFDLCEIDLVGIDLARRIHH